MRICFIVLEIERLASRIVILESGKCVRVSYVSRQLFDGEQVSVFQVFFISASAATNLPELFTSLELEFSPH